ncbi:MAG: TGS domain-containing protein [Pseudomonadota bacterium]
MDSILGLLERQVLPELLRGDPEVAAPYAEGGRLDHYLGLARTLDSQIADPDLTVAAFLHGAPLARARNLLGVPPAAFAILEDWQALRRVTPASTPAAATAFQGDVRALALSIYDCLQRLDPDQKLRRWSCGFHTDPGPLDGDLPDVGPDGDAFLQRVESVIAPLARAWGFWMEGDALLDAVLYHRDQARFREIADFVTGEGLAERGCPRHIAAVKAALERVQPRHQVRWEWRHPASTSANLEGINRSEWRKALFRCGFVALLAGERSCYYLLGRLHAAMSYRRQDIRDYLGEPTPSGYRALHTRLLPTDALGALTVSVRIVPTEGNERRFDLADAEHLARLMERKVPGRSTLRLYTPTGDLKELPPGATVLNFACAVHADFAALATHAVVNRDREVGLLHALADGDEVNVVSGEVPRPLPEGWEDAVPKSTRERIRTAWQRAWRVALAAEGDRWLRKQLAIPAGEPRVVQALVELAAEEVAAEHKDGGHGASWWLTQFALHFGSLQAPPGAATARVDAARTREMLAKVEEKTKALLRVSERAEIQAPEKLRGRLRRIRLCPACRPGRARNLVATSVWQDGGIELVLHRPDEPCAQGGLPLALRDRVALEQFFVVETNNQAGVALKVLATFEDEGIDLVEVTGRRLGPDWGVFRIEVEPIGPKAIRQIKRRLLALDNVHSVRTPLEAGSAVLEAALPPRTDGQRNPLTRPQPYICGPTAIDDQHFYGREDEVGFLFDLLRRVRNDEAGRGLMCHIRGPLRIGKSSLALRFQLLLRRQPELGAIPVYAKVEVGEPWSRLQKRLERALARELAEVWRAWGEPGPVPQGEDLEATLRLLAHHPRRPSVVLAVDEVNRLFGACGQSLDELRDLLRFRDLVDTTPGLLALWIGPAAGVRDLRPEVQDLLLASQPLVVRPFTLEQATALLEARKLALFHTIVLDRNLGRRLFRLTGGEPFWLGHLAQVMWTLRQNTGSRVVRFDHAVADAACRELMERHELFAVRVEPRTRARREDLAWAVAALLARDAPEADDRGLSVADVAERLGLDAPRAGRVLDTLKDRGALLVHEGEPRRWCIAFPLLAEYLNQHHKHRLPRVDAHA